MLHSRLSLVQLVTNDRLEFNCSNCLISIYSCECTATYFSMPSLARKFQENSESNFKFSKRSMEKTLDSKTLYIVKIHTVLN